MISILLWVHTYTFCTTIYTFIAIFLVMDIPVFLLHDCSESYAFLSMVGSGPARGRWGEKRGSCTSSPPREHWGLWVARMAYWLRWWFVDEAFDERLRLCWEEMSSRARSRRRLGPSYEAVGLRRGLFTFARLLTLKSCKPQPNVLGSPYPFCLFSNIHSWTEYTILGSGQVKFAKRREYG